MHLPRWDRPNVEVRGETVAHDGRPAYMRGAILDVTEQRAAESERLEAVSMFRQGFDTAPIGMVLTDADTGWCIRVNDAMCAMLDRPREQLIGASLDVGHPSRRSSRAFSEARGEILDGSRPSVSAKHASSDRTGPRDGRRSTPRRSSALPARSKRCSLR